MSGYELFDGMTFSAEPHGAAGKLPTAWRLLKVGDNRLKKRGRDFVIRLSAEDIIAALRHQAEMGEKLPIDSRHALFLAAEKAGVSEAEMLKSVPQGVAALGFGSLGERDGDLWIEDVEWLPLAAELLRQGQLRYFSPVVRGLGGAGPFRVTSVAMDNVPALCDLDVLAASGEVPELRKTNKEVVMKELEKALRQLLGDDALTLGAETETALAEKVTALAATLPELREQAAKVEALSAEASALELAAETAKKTQLIDGALADGRVCKAQKGTLLKLDSVALAEFLAAIPPDKTVPVTPAPAADSQETVALSAEEVAMAKKMGIAEKDMLEEKKRQLLAQTEGGK